MIICHDPLPGALEPWLEEETGRWLVPYDDPALETWAWFVCPPLPDDAEGCYHDPNQGLSSRHTYALAPDGTTVQHCSEYTFDREDLCALVGVQQRGIYGLNGPEATNVNSYVPEPSALAGLAAGLIALALIGRRRAA